MLTGGWDTPLAQAEVAQRAFEGCDVPEDLKAAIFSLKRGVDDFAPTLDDLLARLEASEYGGLNPVHTVNNAMIVVMALIYGQMDVERATAIAVMAGLDTDCNGATVGSICGAAQGAARMPGSLAGQLNDTIKPAMVGVPDVKMADLAARTLKVWKALQSV